MTSDISNEIKGFEGHTSSVNLNGVMVKRKYIHNQPINSEEILCVFHINYEECILFSKYISIGNLKV